MDDVNYERPRQLERTLREKELEAKEHQFQHERGMKERAHIIEMTNKQDLLHAKHAASLLNFHGKHGDEGANALAHGMVQSHPPQHIAGIVEQLHAAGAHKTAQVLAAHASGAMNNSG